MKIYKSQQKEDKSVCEHQLKDKNGTVVEVGQTVRINDKYYGVYEAPVIFKDGMFTIDKYKARQIKNRDGWLEGLKKTFPNQDKKHNQTESYGFIVSWGEIWAKPLISYSHTPEDLEVMK